MKRFATLTSGVALSAIVVGCGASSPTAPSVMGMAGTSLTQQHNHGAQSFTTSDLSYMTSAAQTQRLLFELGKLAHNRGDHPRVKAFGFQIMQEMAIRLNDLSEMSGGRVDAGITLSSEGQTAVGALALATGSALDRQVVQALFTQLQSAITALPRQSGGTSPGFSEHATAFAGRMRVYVGLLRDVARFVGVTLT